MNESKFQVGDLIVKIVPNQFRDTAITIGKPYKVIKVRDEDTVIQDDNGFKYEISDSRVKNRWVLSASTNEDLVYLLKGG